MVDRVQIMIMAKAPVPGAVKTRLCPPCSPVQAAGIAAAALDDTIDAARATGAGVVLALAGDVTSIRRQGVRVVAQRGETFAERLEHAWRSLPDGGLQVGMDTPQVTPAVLRDALALVEATGSALGLALDGGWWAIGMRHPVPGVFAGVPMSVADTGARQLARMVELGLRPASLPSLRDLDTWQDACRLLDEIPAGRTGRSIAAVRDSLAPVVTP